MKLRLTALAVVLGLTVALSASAETTPGPPNIDDTLPEPPPGAARFHAFSEGGTPCEDVLKAIAAERANRPPGFDYQTTGFEMPYIKLVFWMDGYLSARNELDPDHRTTGRGLGIETRMRWIEGYCRQLPYEVFIHALSAMREQMIEENR